MSSQIRLKRGLKANLPKLVQGEPAYTTDTQEVFIGNGTTNVQLAKKSDLDGYIRNDQNSTINGSLTINATGKIIDLKSNGYTDSGAPYNSEYVFETIPAISAFGSYCENGGIELKQLGTIDDGSGDTLPGLLKLSTDVNINGALSVTGNITASTQTSTDNSTKVATTAFVKSVTGDVSTLKTDTKTNIVAAINEIEDDLSNASIITPSVIFGMNNKITNTGEVTNSPTFTIKGKTVVNLLGKDGNCEDISKWTNVTATSSLDSSNKVFGNSGIKIILTAVNANINNTISKYNLDTSKYYLLSAYLKNGNATSIKVMKDSTGGGTSVSSTLVTDTSKFNRVGIVIKPSDFNAANVLAIYVNGTSGQYAYVDGIMINEITASEYALGVNALLANYPYVDSYVCLQNPYLEVKHDNLVRNGNGEEGTAWWEIDSTMNLSIVNGKFQLKTTVASSSAHQDIKVKPNTNYYLSGNTSGNTGLVVYNGGLSLLRNGVGTFNSGNYDFIRLYANNVNIGTGTFDSIMLVEGTTAPSSYKSCRIERTVLETKLTSDDSIVYKNGEVTGQIWWKHKTLYGKDYDWQFNEDYTGVKNIKLDGAIDGMNNIIGNNIPVKYTGDILKVGNSSYANVAEMYFDTGSTTRLKFGIADSDSGWTETINPTNDEVKAFMNGWKAIYNDSTRYCGWVSVIDGSVPSGSANSSITATSSGTTVTVADGTKFVASDNLDIVSSTGTVKANIQISSISGNVLTLNRSVSVVTGDVVMKLNSEMVTWCKNNVAPGYEGYQIHYKLQNPESINDNNCIIHGDIPLFDVGDNYLYLDSGIVLGEVANPYNNGTNYVFNSYLTYTTTNLLKNKMESFISVYKNGTYETNTSWQSSYLYIRGNGVVNIPAVNFDTNATYTIDYKILATQTPRIGTISCSYSQDINSAISNIQESLNSKQAHDSILDQIVDKSLYEKINYVLRARPAALATNSCRICLPLTFSTKKCIPMVTIDSQTFVARTDNVGGYTVLNNSDVTVVVALYSNQNATVYITYVGNNAIINNNLMAYGIEASFNITLDCRGRI